MVGKAFPKNVMEDLVDCKLDEMMHAAKMCCCERCRADVLALVLNKLPSRYVVSVSGDVYTRFQALDTQMQADITAAIISAIEVVRQLPHHDEVYV
jgi:competence protein ComFB